MSQPGKPSTGSSVNLLPHQAALVETFFNPASKRVVLLRGDVGLGKSAALVALACHLLQERPMARVLLLAPNAIGLQFVERLSRAGTMAQHVDRYRYREMLDATIGEELWPSGVVSVLSPDFARQPDIQSSLAATHWAAMIADEAHSIRGDGVLALQRIAAAADRVVLATATPTCELDSAFPPADTAVVEWRRDQIVDHDGRPFRLRKRPVLKEVSFSQSSAEWSDPRFD